MQRFYPSWLLGCAAVLFVPSCQRDHASSAPDSEIEIIKRDWRGNQAMLVAGEQATDCTASAAAMRTVFTAHRNDFFAAQRLIADRDAVKRVTDYIEAHPTEFPDLDPRWQTLTERCEHDAAFQAIMREKALDPSEK
ncbi:MAG: hypothetical protein ABI591_18140 [Kofleriaceae bacterium]